MCKLFFGFAIYSYTKKTPSWGHQALIRLFSLTGGASSDFISRCIIFINPKKKLIGRSQLLEVRNKDELTRIIESIAEDGFYISPKRLSEASCDLLMQFALQNKAICRKMDGDSEWVSTKKLYIPGKPEAVRYDFEVKDLLGFDEVQSIIADIALPTIAQEYFQSRPYIDVISMWWATNFKNSADMEAAQFYHFDLDRVKWLKCFIYLTDVDECNGPHVFIKGTHKAGAIPSAILKKGYSRLMDAEIASNFGSDSVIEFKGPRGTIILEDTRGLHKGKKIISGHRLILQIQFSNSLFGANYPKERMPKITNIELSQAIKKNTFLYSEYL